MALVRQPPPGLLVLSGTVALVAGFALSALLPAEGYRVPPPEDLERRSQDLDQQLERAHRRAAAKFRILRAVADARMGLLEAASCNQALTCELPPSAQEDFRRRWPAPTDEERHCRHVIEVAARLEGAEDPCSATALRARLEEELQDHLRRGPLVLPPVDGARMQELLRP
jgi:hypothetical protein